MTFLGVYSFLTKTLNTDVI